MVGGNIINPKSCELGFIYFGLDEFQKLNYKFDFYTLLCLKPKKNSYLLF